MSSNQWEVVKLEDLLEIKYGKDHKALGDGNIPVYGSGGIMRYADRALYEGETILIPRKGSLNNIFYINSPFWSVDTMFYSKIKHGINGKYLFYYLKTLDFVSMNVGSAVPSMTTEVLNKLEVLLPSKNIQDKIASILSSIDLKIDHNKQTNETLEKLVKTLFQEMCVSKNIELQEGWQLLKLEEFIELKNGYAFKGMDFIDEGVPVIKIKNVKAGKVILNQLSYVSREVAVKAQRFRIKQNDLLITMSGNRIDGTPETWVGKVGIFHRNGEYLLNQRVSILNIIDEGKMSKYFLSQLLSSEEYQYYFISNATSSGGQANISPDLIYNTEIVVPPIEQLQQFNKLAKDIYNKIFANELEVETLTNLRDNLLPKLMKGEIKV
jgi:type I restriction enzyme, S subunit